MKKCPYCGKEIQDRVILCNHCGRDLRTPAATQGAKASVVLSALYALNAYLVAPNQSELVGDLTIGLAGTFLFWWLICTFIVAAWRSISTPRNMLQPARTTTQPQKDNSARNALFCVIGISAVLVFLGFNGSYHSSNTSTPTRTLIPTRTPNRNSVMPTATPKPISLKACVTNSTIRVRRGPGTDFEVIDGIVSGTCMQIVARNQDSTWVYMVSEDNITGWVNASLLTIDGKVNRVSIRSVAEVSNSALATKIPPTAILQPTTTRKAFVFASSTARPALNAFIPLCSQTANRNGDLVTCKIERAYCDYLPDVDGSPTFCNDRPYPNQNFALVVFGENWNDYDGFCIIVTGRVYLYGGVAQILASSRSQVSYC